MDDGNNLGAGIGRCAFNKDRPAKVDKAKLDGFGDSVVWQVGDLPYDPSK